MNTSFSLAGADNKQLAFLLSLVTFLLFITAACGGNSAERYGLSGEVTFAGKPVPSGMIYFEPDVSKGNKGPQGFAQITDGKYNTDKFGKGAVSGPLVVSVVGFSAESAANAESAGRPLFPRYSTRIELAKEASTFNFEVPAGYKPEQSKQRRIM